MYISTTTLQMINEIVDNFESVISHFSVIVDTHTHKSARKLTHSYGTRSSICRGEAMNNNEQNKMALETLELN